MLLSKLVRLKSARLKSVQHRFNIIHALSLVFGSKN
jgi:hypothetical protein